MDFRSPAPAPPRRKRSAVLAFLLALAAVPSLLFASGQLLINDFNRSHELREEVDASFRRRAQLQTVLSLLQDVETGQRGYLLTGDERFLEPRERARRRLPGELETLDQLFVAEAGPKVVEVRRLTRQKIAFTDRTIALKRAGAAAEANRMVRGGYGKRVMDDVRTVIARLDEWQSDKLGQRVAMMQSASRDAQRLVIVLHVLLVLLLAASALIISQILRARRRALARVNELSTRQSAILDGARDGIVMLDSEGTIESINAAAAEMYGYEPAELRGRDVGMLFEMNLDDHGGSGDSFLSRRRRSTSQSSGLVHELWGRRRHGSSFPIDVSISPVALEDGTRYVAIIRDVTERRQMEQLTTDFVSIVSHELRTPLTSIAGSLGLIAGGAVGGIPDKAMRLIDIAKSNSERLVRLINDILDIEKIESGAVQFDVRPTSLKPLIEDTLAANAGFAASHEVMLGLGECPSDACGLVDPDGFVQILTNLVSNAVKFSPEGEQVEVSVRRHEACFRLTVADRGPGIPEEFRSRIFTKFAQADSSDTRRRGGTGLGLSIAREIAVRLGGALGFEDRPGGGTVFHVDLPAAAGSDDKLRAQGLPRVLHVDDDPLIRRLVAKAFSRHADIRYAPTLAAARAFLAEETFDLAILDIALPDGSGLALLPELHGAGQRTPTVLFSARDLDTPEAAQADAIVPKSPATVERLVETASMLLDAQRKAA